MVDPVALRSPDVELEQEALRCLREARFKPMTLNGIVGKSYLELVIEFRLRP